MQVIYRKKKFVVYRFEDEYIIHNTSKPFKNYHTHLKNYNTAKFIINAVLNKMIPKDLHIYLLESILRITDDKEYATKIKQLIDTRNRRTKTTH